MLKPAAGHPLLLWVFTHFIQIMCLEIHIWCEMVFTISVNPNPSRHIEYPRDQLNYGEKRGTSLTDSH